MKIVPWIIATVVASCLGGPTFACEGRLLEDDSVFASPLCVPKAPKRVVVLDPSVGLGVALDVGLEVVGAPLERMSDESLRQRAEAGGVSNIGFVAEPSLERIVALQPDLILGYIGDRSLAEALHPQLSQIAPTLLETAVDWRAFYFTMAGLTGATDKVDEAFQRYDARLAEIRSKMPETVVSILRITSWDFQVYLDGPKTYAPFGVARAAGLKRTDYETTTRADLTLKRPDWEELAELDGETLLYIIGGTNDSAEDGRYEEVISSPLWKFLPAVQTGRVHRIDPATWMEFSGLASAHRVLDDLERFVIAEP